MFDKKESTFILKVDRAVYGGLSIGRYAGKVVMIKGHVLPEETVEVIQEHEKKDYLSVSVKRIIEPSNRRIEPRCDYYGICGGCNFQHIPYPLQVKLKEQILADCCKRLANIQLPLSESLISNNPWHYRLRGQFKVSRGDIGFYQEKTRKVVNIHSCPLMADEINHYLQKARLLLNGIPLREIHITGVEAPGAMIKTSACTYSESEWKKLASQFLESGFSGLFVETQDKQILRYGQPYTTLRLDTLIYTISPVSFFQSNWKLNQKVVELMKSGLRPLNGQKVLDLYAGAGNFCLPLADDAEAAAVEENPYAVEDGRRNVKMNNIKHCRFIRSSAENFIPKEGFDIVILDPPRPGLTKRAMNNVLKTMPARIAYISCNPATLARDLKKLQSSYDIDSVRLIDFFPQTHHIEALAFLSRRNQVVSLP